MGTIDILTPEEICRELGGRCLTLAPGPQPQSGGIGGDDGKFPVFDQAPGSAGPGNPAALGACRPCLAGGPAVRVLSDSANRSHRRRRAECGLGHAPPGGWATQAVGRLVKKLNAVYAGWGERWHRGTLADTGWPDSAHPVRIQRRRPARRLLHVNHRLPALAMCGILGFIGTRWRDHAETALAALRLRGPDEQSVLNVGEAVFGHARLAVIDLAGGHQPMRSPDGRYTMVFNGEIYNFAELRAGTRSAWLRVRHPLRHRGAAARLRRLGRGAARPAGRHVRLRRLGRP